MPELPLTIDSDGTDRTAATTLPGGDYSLRIDDSDLAFIRIDFRTLLQFGATEVTIGCPFSLRRQGSEEHLDPEDRDSLGSILSLYPDSLRAASIDSGGTLLLKFVSGAEIAVPQNPVYEAWQVKGPGAQLVISRPGTTGDLAIWS